MIVITQCQLLRFLEDRSPEYYGKVLELREVATGWLAYVPQTFPHYTRHTVEHSDAIVFQLSHLLFENDDIASAMIRLSGVEAYALIASALLHDCGMVVSDAEKAQILASEEWMRWASGIGASRLTAISDFRKAGGQASDPVRDLIADTQLRRLIAEHVRRVHHTRSGQLAELHQ